MNKFHLVITRYILIITTYIVVINAFYSFNSLNYQLNASVTAHPRVGVIGGGFGDRFRGVCQLLNRVSPVKKGFRSTKYEDQWDIFLERVSLVEDEVNQRLYTAYINVVRYESRWRFKPYNDFSINLVQIHAVAEMGTNQQKEQLIALLRKTSDIAVEERININQAYVKAHQLIDFPQFESESDLIAYLKRSNKKARALALQYHDGAGQKYAGRPYSSHLHAVRDVLKRFGFGPRDSVLGLMLGTLAWMHDLVEDTSVMLADVYYLFGRTFGNAIDGVTNVPKLNGMSRKERELLTKMKTMRGILERILKLADRTANTEESALSHFLGRRDSKIGKYIRQWPSFQSMLRVPGEADALWDHLEKLTTGEDYARKYLISIGRLDPP